ncbi:hypothetical protein BA746_00290 [Vibrio parahaemolyticus]|uniref:hypothetical protein n=1 Tax=Vibrio parahaemolyticus TaxID=670 RepID=UPI0006A59D68|nr:hypothetical protein [Vibrio parahaemolyticus]KOF30942.1 hypothetical protein ACX04_15895 [Vibrio parahaemolyticus]OTW07808.1 hypothetical protein BA743_16285 [Vibrio parahaemolyticus]OTW23957.1 hypothetical protein BA744_01090 [Vibrio parahaemolyticus]OTW27233.1 hypothetical protein BA746_00290 [Vibrio parahaemolyticus]
MNDIIDIANERVEQNLQAAINAARKSTDTFLLKGICHNCGEHLDNPNGIFCDSACAEDYEQYINRNKHVYAH